VGVCQSKSRAVASMTSAYLSLGIEWRESHNVVSDRPVREECCLIAESNVGEPSAQNHAAFAEGNLSKVTAWIAHVVIEVNLCYS
jgi:hypothetical protein